MTAKSNRRANSKPTSPEVENENRPTVIEPARAAKPKTAPRSKVAPPRPSGQPGNGAGPDALEENLTGEQADVSVAPKTFLTPYVLLMLRDSLLHGYAIWEQLTKMRIPGLNESDRASIYRTLRQLEREGKVKSEWDTNNFGPARRVYTLTDAGEQFLQIWAVGLDQYRQSLDFFFKMYTGGALPSPFGFPFTNLPGNLNANTKGDKKDE